MLQEQEKKVSLETPLSINSPVKVPIVISPNCAWSEIFILFKNKMSKGAALLAILFFLVGEGV